MDDLEDIVRKLAQSKVEELSTWKQVRWEGGRLYYEGNKIVDELKEFPVNIQIIYLQTIYNEDFTIHDNCPNSTPDITAEFKLWLEKRILKLKIAQIQTSAVPIALPIEEIPLRDLPINEPLRELIKFRINEISECYKAKAFLSVIFLIGSTLEGILMGLAKNNCQAFNSSPISPKDRSGKVKPVKDWKLYELIEVANSIGLVDEDVKKHSHSIRDFRNYIHPEEQLKTQFIPDENTAKIAWHVLKACIDQIIRNAPNL